MELFGTLFIIIIYAYPNINCYSITCTTLPQIDIELVGIQTVYALNTEDSVEHKHTLGSFKTNWQQFQKIAEKILALSKGFAKEDALDLIVKDGKVAYKKSINNLRGLIEQHRNDMKVLNNNALQVRWEAMTQCH